MRVRRIALLVVLVALIFLGPMALNHARSAGFVIRAAGMHGWWADPLASLQSGAVTTEDTTIEVRAGRIRGRIYRPASTTRRTILLTGGVHA